MSHERNHYPSNLPREVAAGGRGFFMPGQLPHNAEVRQSHSFYKNDDEYYQNMPFPIQLPGGLDRGRAGYVDDRALVRQQGFNPSQGMGRMTPIKDQ